MVLLRSRFQSARRSSLVEVMTVMKIKERGTHEKMRNKAR